MEIDKKTSTTLMVANLIATVLVIAIHYNSKAYIDPSQLNGWNYIFQEFMANGIARVAVPYFALLSGFFLATKLNGVGGYVGVLKNKALTLLVPYILVSTLIFITVRIMLVAAKGGAILNDGFLIDIFVHPLSGQFWFLRDLIILVVASPILLGQKSKLISYALTAALGLLWVFNIQPFPIVGKLYIINIESIFFLCAGGLLSRSPHHISNNISYSLPTKASFFIAWLVLVGLRVYVDPTLDVWYTTNYTIYSILLYKASILVGIASLIQLSSFLVHNKTAIYLSGLTFFAFLFHLHPLWYFTKLTNKFIESSYGFYLNFPISVVLVFFAAYLTSKYIPRVYAFTTGGRDPAKALKRLGD